MVGGNVIIEISENYYHFSKAGNDILMSSNCLNSKCPIVKKIIELKKKNKSFISYEGKNPNVLFCLKSIGGSLFVGEIISAENGTRTIQLCGLEGSFVSLNHILLIKGDELHFR